MADRALSLLRTVLRPVLSTLPFGTGQARAGLPQSPHHAVPAIHLSGVILDRAAPADVQIAEAMYGGAFNFAGEHVMALPDTVFTAPAASSAWRSALLRMDWLSSFRASNKTLHSLYALRLLSAWVSVRPHTTDPGDQIAALYNLAVDAPAIAASQSPAAIAMATAAILQAQNSVLKLKPRSTAEALSRGLALLAAHLATKRPDAHRSKLIQEISEYLHCLVCDDGSMDDGSIISLHRLHSDLSTLLGGLQRSEETIPPVLDGILARINAYFTLIMRPDRSLAFAKLESLLAPASLRPLQESALAHDAGHARLVGGKTLLLASFGATRETKTLQIEIHDGNQPLLWLQQMAEQVAVQRDECTVICAAGGSLLEIQGHNRLGDKQRLAVFLSGDGSDIRLEDTHGSGTAATYLLHAPELAKLSTTHGGTGAMIVLGPSQAWQVLVRGGHIELEHGYFRLLPDRSAGQFLNFALKRLIAAERPSRSSKSTRERAPQGSGSGSGVPLPGCFDSSKTVNHNKLAVPPAKPIG